MMIRLLAIALHLGLIGTNVYWFGGWMSAAAIGVNVAAIAMHGGFIVFGRNNADRKAEASDFSTGADPGSYLLPTSFANYGTSARTSVPHQEFEGGVIRGWRLFSVVHDENGFARLQGTRGLAWESAEIEAECRIDDVSLLAAYVSTMLIRPQAAVAPQPKGKAVGHLRDGSCQCGVYLMKSLPASEVVATFIGSQQAVAECVVWGEVVEHEHGWRAEHCRIERIFMHDGNKYLMEQMRDRYGCPVLSSREYANALLGAEPLPHIIQEARRDK